MIYLQLFLSFLQIGLFSFGGGYAAGYYAYLWTQMLADDGYQWFVEQGGLTRENGQTFREVILSRGSSSD